MTVSVTNQRNRTTPSSSVGFQNKVSFVFCMEILKTKARLMEMTGENTESLLEPQVWMFREKKHGSKSYWCLSEK